jgi:hypothetical protein
LIDGLSFPEQKRDNQKLPEVKMKEIWKDIPGYEGLYQASSLGRIKTVEGKVTSNRRYSKRVWKSRIMKGRGDNYSTGRRVSLWKDGKVKDFLVARLVAITFLGEPLQGYTVNHKDGDRMNNQIDNLEWLSRGDNIRHAFDNGLYSAAIKIYVTCTDGYRNNFRSLSEFDRYIGRRVGYTSNALKQNRKVTDVDGRVYHVEFSN